MTKMVSRITTVNTNIQTIQFHTRYNNIILHWFQFMEDIFGFNPKFVHIIDEVLLIFVEPWRYYIARHSWMEYLKIYKNRPKYHVRILKFTHNLEELVFNWFENIKKMKIEISDFYSDLTRKTPIKIIKLFPPKHLAHILTGRDKKELNLLQNFIETTTKIKLKIEIQS